MNESQALARAMTLAYLTVANLALSKPLTVKEVINGRHQ